MYLLVNPFNAFYSSSFKERVESFIMLAGLSSMADIHVLDLGDGVVETVPITLLPKFTQELRDKFLWGRVMGSLSYMDLSYFYTKRFTIAGRLEIVRYTPYNTRLSIGTFVYDMVIADTYLTINDEIVLRHVPVHVDLHVAYAFVHLKFFIVRCYISEERGIGSMSFTLVLDKTTGELITVYPISNDLESVFEPALGVKLELLNLGY